MKGLPLGKLHVGKQAEQSAFSPDGKTKKLLRKKQKEISSALEKKTVKTEKEAILHLLTSDNPDGSILYSWDKKDVAGVNNAGYKFSRIHDANIYQENITKNEIELYKKHAHEINTLILNEQPQRIIDMGGGDGTKTMQILDVLQKEIFANINLTTKEISPYLGEQYKKNLSEWAKENNIPLQTGFIYENFLEKTEVQSNKDKRLFLFSGGSIGNFDDDTIQHIFSNMNAENVLGKRHILSTFFTAPDKNSSSYDEAILKLKATYGDPDNTNPHFNRATYEATKDWILSGITYWLGDSITDKIDFTVQYEQTPYGGRILSGARVIKPFSIQVGNETIEKKEGDYIWAIQSRRFTPEYFSKLVTSTGKSINWIDSKDGVGLAQIETPYINKGSISKEQKRNWMKYIKVFGAILLLSAGLLAGQEWQKTKAKKHKKEERNIEVNKDLVYNSEYGYHRGTVRSGELIQNSWDAMYKKCFEAMYEVKDLEEIKYDFLSWYAQKTKEGDYAETQLSYYPSPAMIEEYVLENRLRIKYDKGIDLIPHPSMQPYTDLLYKTENIIKTGEFDKSLAQWNRKIDNQGFRGSNSSVTRKHFNYNMRPGGEYTVTIFTIDGNDYMMAKDNSQDSAYSTRATQRIIDDFFTPPGHYKMSRKLSTFIDNEFGDKVMPYGEVRDRLVELYKQGFDIGIKDLPEKDAVDLKAYAFISRYLPELVDKIPDTARKEYYIGEINLHKRISDILLRYLPTEISSNTRKKNLVISHMFYTLYQDHEIYDDSDDAEIEKWVYIHWDDIIPDFPLPESLQKKYAGK